MFSSCGSLTHAGNAPCSLSLSLSHTHTHTYTHTHTHTHTELRSISGWSMTSSNASHFEHLQCHLTHLLVGPHQELEYWSEENHTCNAFTATCEFNRVEININTSRHQSTSSPLPFAYVCCLCKPLITTVSSTTRVIILWLKQPISSCIIDAMEVQTLWKVSTIASLLGFSLAFTVYKQGESRHVLILA